MKTKIILLLAIAITAALVTRPVFAVPTHQIVITENSSTSLTVTYDGSTTGVTVLNTGMDQWTVTFPTVTFNGVPGDLWTEPENSNFSNDLDSHPGPNLPLNQLAVLSDFSHNGGNPNGSASVTFFGTDTRDGGSVSVTFNDNGDAVPDAGSTFGLLFLSLIALLGATRLRSVKLA